MRVLAAALPWWQSTPLVIGLVALAVAITARSVSSRLVQVARTPTSVASTSSGSGELDSVGAPSATRCGSAMQSLRQLALRVRSTRPRPIPPERVAGWCDALSRRLRAGESLRASLESDRPDDPALLARTEPLRRSLGNGASVASAVEAIVGAASPNVGRDPHLALLCSVLAAATDFGGGAAVPIDRVGATLRLRMADGQERAAQSAQARLSAHVLTVVPLGVLALLAGTDAEVRQVSTSGIGLAVVACGLVLNFAGWCWMNRVVAGEAP